MMKLYLYGYQNTIRSCRKLEKACKTNIEVMWLINQQKPHYKTIANFRKDNAVAFKEVFRYFVALLKDWSLIGGNTIAIDSFKIRAQNSLKNNFNARKVKRHIDYIDQKILDYEMQLDQEYDQEIVDKVSYNLGKKDRQTLLSKTVLKDLRNYYKEFKPYNFLFEGQKKEKYSASSVLKIVKKAAKLAKINKVVTPHMLRHSFATHLLETVTDIRVIQTILGHNSIKTTEIYTHVATNQIKTIKNPLD